MNFLTPAAFALAALIPVVIAMYLLKLRRTEQIVSSVYLWRRMVRDVEANAPWQRLRRNLLLILQLLVLAALILALTPNEQVVHRASLFYGVAAIRADAPEHTREILDTSARHVLGLKWAKKGAQIVVVSGRPLYEAGCTNTLVVHTV